MQVSETEIYGRLARLTEHGDASGVASYTDNAARLSGEKRESWSRFLSSIATTESIEQTLISPISKTFSKHYGDQPEVSRYIEAHASDERRHHRLLTEYVKSTFHYEKKKRTGSDVLIYDTLLPNIARIGTVKPLYFLAMLHFYEAFSTHFYKSLKKSAETDGLPELLRLIQSIEKDELRHLAGLEGLVHLHHSRAGQPGRLDLLAIRALLELLLIDIKTARWAFHNRKVRRNVILIGLDPEIMDRDASEAARHSLRFVQNPLRRNA